MTEKEFLEHCECESSGQTQELLQIIKNRDAQLAAVRTLFKGQFQQLKGIRERNRLGEIHYVLGDRQYLLDILEQIEKEIKK